MKKLKTYLPYASFNQTAPLQWSVDPSTPGNWTLLTPGVFAGQSVIDLAGLSMDSKTVYPQAANVQTAYPASGSGQSAGDIIQQVDLMTSIPLALDTTNIVDFLFGFGFPGSHQDYEHVIYARTTFFTFDLDYAQATPVVTHRSQYGSLEPTASDRIYCYRIVAMPTNPLVTNIQIPAGRFLILADTKEEPEFQYLMRLKRSYELQQSHDED